MALELTATDFAPHAVGGGGGDACGERDDNDLASLLLVYLGDTSGGDGNAALMRGAAASLTRALARCDAPTLWADAAAPAGDSGLSGDTRMRVVRALATMANPSAAGKEGRGVLGMLLGIADPRDTVIERENVCFSSFCSHVSNHRRISSYF